MKTSRLLAGTVLAAALVGSLAGPAAAMRTEGLRESTNVIDCRPGYSSWLYRWWNGC
jgi:hypothetical protein